MKVIDTLLKAIIRQEGNWIDGGGFLKLNSMVVQKEGQVLGPIFIFKILKFL